MAMTPAQKVGGVVNFATETITTTQYGVLVFSADRKVLAANAVLTGGTFPIILGTSGSGQTISTLYVDSTVSPIAIKSLPINTAVEVRYQYIQD